MGPAARAQHGPKSSWAPAATSRSRPGGGPGGEGQPAGAASAARRRQVAGQGLGPHRVDGDQPWSSQHQRQAGHQRPQVDAAPRTVSTRRLVRAAQASGHPRRSSVGRP